MIRLSRLDSNYLKLRPENDLDINRLTGLMNDKFIITEWNKMTERYDSHKLYEVSLDGDNNVFIKIFIGFNDKLIEYLSEYEIEYIKDDYEVSGPGLTIIDKWKDILDTDFRVINGRNQYQYLLELVSSNRGMGQFYTG